MSDLLEGWYADAGPGGGANHGPKCGGLFASGGVRGKSTISNPFPGSVSVTDTIVLNNFPYLVGKSVQVCIGGLDCGNFTVAADGSLTVPYGSDAGGLLTASYLSSISSPGSYGAAETKITITDSLSLVTTVSVPVVVGYGYTSQGKLPRAVSQDEMKTPKGPGVGKTRRKHMWAAYLWNAVTWKLGTSFDHLQTYTPVQGDLTTPLPATSSFTGIHQDTLDDTYGFDGQVCWQVDRPVPLGVLSLTSWDDTEDR